MNNNEFSIISQWVASTIKFNDRREKTCYNRNMDEVLQISSFDSFGDIIEAHNNRFSEKMLEIFAVWVDFPLARFN